MVWGLSGHHQCVGFSEQFPKLKIPCYVSKTQEVEEFWSEMEESCCVTCFHGSRRRPFSECFLHRCPDPRLREGRGIPL